MNVPEVRLAAPRVIGDPNDRTPASHLFRGAPRGHSEGMFEEFDMTAAEVRGYLSSLEAERALAIDTGVAEVEPYIADLDEEIELWRHLYVAFAVTEIATLRAELSGPLAG